MKKKPYVGDVGTFISADMAADISSASARIMRVKKPDGSTVIWPAVADGTTAVGYTTVAGTLDMPGTWLVQPRVILGSGEWSGETGRFEVYGEYR